MPLKSQAQRAWMHIHHPKMAARWEKETPKGKLPKHVASEAGVGELGLAVDVETSPANQGYDESLGLTVGMMLCENDPIKGEVYVAGIPVWVEWKRGETRLYRDKETGQVTYRKLMNNHYGYIPGTKDADGEELDVYVGPNLHAPKAWIIRQLTPVGDFDENKVMLGFPTRDEAESCYMHHMAGSGMRLGSMEEVPAGALRALFGQNGQVREATGDPITGIKRLGMYNRTWAPDEEPRFKPNPETATDESGQPDGSLDGEADSPSLARYVFGYGPPAGGPT